ncbi:hypothetical protein GYA93_13710 [Gordonia desulfuricans]|uniref:SPOR domain-containing protein n=1 Tax=Gordonia desulfuricans TaxID=89051 RepID=A0A7K3LSX0_9ACTN|nr:hypothetical protein [Gordonia desulfuricans]NDK90627.1 hypothetical protein [Gordonia desulfuricans]
MTPRSQWVLPVVIGSVIGVIVIVAVIFGVRWSRSTWGDSVATGTTSPTTVTSVVTQTTTVARSTTRTPGSRTTEPRTTESRTTPERETTGAERTTRPAPVPPVASAHWYAQFGAFDDYDNAVAVRDEHYGSLILPGEMLGSPARYVVARPATSQAVAQQVCDHFSTGHCLVKERW